MKTTWTWAALVAGLVIVSGAPARAQDAAAESGTVRVEPLAASESTSAIRVEPIAAVPANVAPPEAFAKLDYSGPRIGLMFPVASEDMRRAFRDRGYGDMVSLFGWHFERTIVPIEGGPRLVTEAVPMLGGVEYGKILPSVTFTVGLRLRSGIEFGMGPSFTPINSRGGTSAGLVMAVGKSINYAGLNLPVDLAVSRNPRGTMVSVTVGYAMRHDS